MKNIVSHFPQTIDKLTFVRVLHQEPVRLSYQFALYEDSKGKKFLCKLWTGTSNDADKAGLLNEIAVYTAFQRVPKTSWNKLMKQYALFVIPEMVAHMESDTQIYLVIEYLPGTFLAKSANKKKAVEIYAKASRFFQELSKVSAFLQNVPTQRTALHFFVLYHLALVKACARYPQLIGLLLRSVIPAYTGFAAMISDRRMSFVHRDLGGYNNVLVTKEKFVLIDFQISALCHPLVELANCVATRKQDSAFLTAFFSSPTWADLQTRQSDFVIFRSLLLYGVLFNIATTPEKEASDSMKLFKRGLGV